MKEKDSPCMSDNLPTDAVDAVYVESEIVYDWKDRIRILFGKHAHIKTRTPMPMPLNFRVETDRVQISVDRIFRRRRPMMGYVESKPEEAR